MKTKVIFLILALFSISESQVINWDNFTDMKNVRSFSVSSDGIWAATSGGAFFYNLTDNSYRTFHKVDGFSGLSLTTTVADDKGRIWFGSNTGTIDMINLSDYTVKPILDIFNSTKQQKGINNFIISDDSIFIATDYGISIIDVNSFVFVDTYSKFGSLSSNIKVVNVAKGNLIYAGLENAVAIQKPGAVNLSSPDAWDTYNLIHNSLTRKINYVTEFNSTLLAACDYGVFYFNGSGFTPFINELTTKNISKIKVIDGILYISTGDSLFRYDSQLTEVIQTGANITDFQNTPAGFFISTEDGILKLSEGQIIQQIKPNAPYTNLFPSLTVDSEGNLWSASSRGETGGFYKLKDNIWTNYNIVSNPEIVTNAYFNTFSIGNEVYLGSWGHGFIQIKNGEFKQYNVSNTPMRGTPRDPDFLVIGGISKDSRGNLWILNYEPVTLDYLSMLTPDSLWYNFKVPSMQNQIIYDNFGLVIDQENTKWFFSKSTSRPGLFYFNENNTFDNTADDKSGYISEGLNSSILSLIVDNRGDIWIGTGLGVNVITNASATLTSPNQLRISSVFALRQQSINCIAVDPLNRKWIGTNQGLLLVNSDGSALLESYDISNSPLLSNEIRSLTIDQQTGIVYAGTDAGLTAFETSAKKPLDTFAELTIYPNPLILKNQETLVTIEGLIKDTDIKILSITGKLIKQFSSPGGRVAYWDGKNLEGQFVNSGIYIIVASDKDGNSVKSAKVAVLKE